MMVPNEIMKAAVVCNKAAFDCVCKSIIILEGYSEKVTQNMVSENGSVSNEHLSIWENVITQYRTYRNDMMKVIEKNYDQAITILK